MKARRLQKNHASNDIRVVIIELLMAVLGRIQRGGTNQRHLDKMHNEHSNGLASKQPRAIQHSTRATLLCDIAEHLQYLP